MDRRRFMLTSLAGALVAPPGVEAQSAQGVPVVGILNSGFALRSHSVDYLRRNLRLLGYLEGQNIALDVRFAGGKTEALSSLATALAHRRVDVLVAIGPSALKAASVATGAIPIVAYDLESDPVQGGFVRSFSRPGGNITGLTAIDPELSGRRLELLKQAVPNLSRVAIFWNPAEPNRETFWSETQNAARALGAHAQSLEIRAPKDLETAFASAAKERTRRLY